MKAHLHDDTPAYLCYGGKQVLAERLYASLRNPEVDVGYAHCWVDARRAVDELGLWSYLRR